LDTADAVTELQRNVERGFQTVFLPTTTPAGREYNREEWFPLWAAAEEAGISLSFHIGTGADPKVYRGLGGAITNHVASFYPAQTTLCHLVASGVLDAHPTLHVSFVESGGSWLPAVMERMDEAQRQYGTWFLRPTLPMLPSEYVKRQVHVSFQHGRAALAVKDICGVDALMWGSDYPHLEGTYPNTRKVLEGIFDGVPDDVRRAITGGNFAKLFSVPEPQAA
jgi:predicted TIM-barrel fold metal-dependent hydrolase